MVDSKDTSDYSGYLSRESLELKRLINIARCAPTGEWPPDDPYWIRLLEDLNFAILHRELDAVVYSKPRFHTVELLPLWGFLTKPKRIEDDRWEPLRDVCRQWAETRGVSLFSSLVDAGRPEDMPTRRMARTDPAADKILEIKIKKVIARAKGKWPDSRKRPGFMTMAKDLAKPKRGETPLGYSQVAIRKILKGTYKPAIRLRIPGL